MKNFGLASFLLTATLATSAFAAQVQFDVPDNLPAATSTVSRAEVIADFLVWRASGLHALNQRVDRGVDKNSVEYQRAQAKYDFLRASPQFTALVEQIKRDGSARLVVAAR